MSDEKKQLSKARQALVDRVLARLDEGAIPWDNGMQGAAELPYNAVSKTHYRGMNVLNLMLSGKSDPRWLTFNQAKDNGYTVKKGAKGVPIELYKIIDKRTGKDADMEQIREEVKDMSYAERMEFKRKNLQTLARSYYLFNASDVIGIEPYVAPTPTQTDISSRNERIERVISNSAAPIFYDGNGRNFYRPVDDEIHLTDRAAFTSDEFFYNTALHEMAHSTGHSSRLDRTGGTFGTKAYAREELVAEIASVLIGAEFGLNHSERVIENSAEYVRSWASLIREDPQTLIDATFDASKATDYICERERVRENSVSAQKERDRHDDLEQSDAAVTARPHATPLVINFYAGPSSGKTTAALELTAALKKAGYNVEYVSEYAKELVLENRLDELNDQQSVTDEQFHRLDRMRDSVDVIVTDSPVLLGLVYGDGKISEDYAKQIREYYDSFDNFNMLMTRPKDATFQTEGRVHDEKQSIELDEKIKAMLDTQGVFYGTYKRDDIVKTVERIGQIYERLYGKSAQKESGAERTVAEHYLVLDSRYGKVFATLEEANAYAQSRQGKDDKPVTVERTERQPTHTYDEKTKKAVEIDPRPQFYPDNIPPEMKAMPHWCCYQRLEQKANGHYTKKVYDCNKGKRESGGLEWAKNNDPTTWTSFENAVTFRTKYKRDGLSFALTPECNITCIDLDECFDANGRLSELAAKLLKFSDGTYAEKSASGKGLHIFYAGKAPQGYSARNDELGIEVYDCKRFMSMTGNRIAGAESALKPANVALTGLLQGSLKKIEQARSMPPVERESLSCSDTELIDRISKSKRGDEFKRLMSGEFITGDRSTSDYMLCNILGFFNGGDVNQVQRIIMQSGLRRQDKPDRYYELTARNACAKLSSYYTPPKAFDRTRSRPKSAATSPSSKPQKYK